MSTLGIVLAAVLAGISSLAVYSAMGQQDAASFRFNRSTRTLMTLVSGVLLGVFITLCAGVVIGTVTGLIDGIRG